MVQIAWMNEDGTAELSAEAPRRRLSGGPVEPGALAG